MENNKIVHIPLNQIRPNPYQPRKTFKDEALEELSKSIEVYGVLQPITVREKDKGIYELVAGERRFRASQLASLEVIPAIIVEFKESDSAIIALMENLQREDLNYIEEAYGYNNLILDHNMTQQDIAKKLGKSQSTIGNKLRLLKLSNGIQVKLLENNLTERHGRALLKLPEEMREEVLARIIDRNYNVKQTDKFIEDILADISKVEEEVKKPSMRGLINTRIYLNTIKNAYKTIIDSGLEAKYKEVDKGDFVEIVVQIPKNNK